MENENIQNETLVDTPVETVTETLVDAVKSEEPAEDPLAAYLNAQKPKKSKTPLIIGGVVAGVAVVVAVVLFLVLGGNKYGINGTYQSQFFDVKYTKSGENITTQNYSVDSIKIKNDKLTYTDHEGNSVTFKMTLEQKFDDGGAVYTLSNDGSYLKTSLPKIVLEAGSWEFKESCLYDLGDGYIVIVTDFLYPGFAAGNVSLDEFFK